MKLIMDESCVICSKSCSKMPVENGRIKEDDCLNRHLFSLFLLRNLLRYPRKQCEDLLERIGSLNPGDWCSLCDSCGHLVESGYHVFQAVMKLEQSLDVVRKELKEKMKRSFVSEDGDVGGVSKDTQLIIRDYYKRSWSTSAPVTKRPIDIVDKVIPAQGEIRVESPVQKRRKKIKVKNAALNINVTAPVVENPVDESTEKGEKLGSTALESLKTESVQEAPLSSIVEVGEVVQSSVEINTKIEPEVDPSDDARNSSFMDFTDNGENDKTKSELEGKFKDLLWVLNSKETLVEPSEKVPLQQPIPVPDFFPPKKTTKKKKKKAIGKPPSKRWCDIEDLNSIRGKWVCQVCGKVYSCKTGLSVHRRSHEGFRYICKEPNCPGQDDLDGKIEYHYLSLHFHTKHPNVPTSERQYTIERSKEKGESKCFHLESYLKTKRLTIDKEPLPTQPQPIDVYADLICGI